MGLTPYQSMPSFSLLSTPIFEISSTQSPPHFSPTPFPKNFSSLEGHLFHEKNKNDYLKFSQTDKRNKFLFLASQDSFGFNSEMGTDKSKLELLKEINQKFDLKFKTVQSYDEICNEIQEAAKVGKLANVIIDANGNSEKICLSKYSDCVNDLSRDQNHSKEELCHQNTSIYDYPISEKICHLYEKECDSQKNHLANIDIDKNKEFEQCFKGLDPNGKIILLTNLAGAPNKNGDYKENIAQKMATLAKRAVIAPINWFIYNTEIPNTEDFEVFQADSDSPTDKNSNIYRLFQPFYKNCLNVSENDLHEREKAAIHAIKKDTQKNSTLIHSTDFENFQDFLRLCKDNPKQKFLYLSMDFDVKGGSLNPTHQANFLKKIHNYYDMKYVVVKSSTELCEEVKKASQIGELTNVLIDGHGLASEICIKGEGTNCQEKITKWDNLQDCLDGVSNSGKIILTTCYSGIDTKGRTNNIAEAILQATGKTVIASQGLTLPNEVKITSIFPFEIFEKTKNKPTKNNYKEFRP